MHANPMPFPIAGPLAPDLIPGLARLTRSPPALSTALAPIDLTSPLTREVI